MRKLKTIIPVAGILLLILLVASYNDIKKKCVEENHL